MEAENIRKLFSELEMLKRVEHQGVKLAGVQSPDSVAEHSLCAAQIACILAELEGANSEQCVLTMIFHDLLETRLGDTHKVTARYLETKDAEHMIRNDQLSLIPEGLSDKIKLLLSNMQNRSTKEGVICKDADSLEVAIQAKIYLEAGYKSCDEWIKNVEEALQTESARKILQIIKEDPGFTSAWWNGLMKVEKRENEV